MLVTQAIPGIIVDEVHARELASVLNSAMALHKKKAQERSNAGRRFHNKVELKLIVLRMFRYSKELVHQFANVV